MKALLPIALVLLTVAVRCPAGFVMDTDHAVFRSDDSLSYVEIYAAIQRANLIYHTVADSQEAAFSVVLDVLSDSEVAMSDTLWVTDVTDTAEHCQPGEFFVHSFRFLMKPGGYRLRMALYQADREPRDSITDSLFVPAFPMDTLGLSDILLGSELSLDATPSRYTKHGVRIIPNPTRFYGAKLPVVYYFLEAYGMDYDPAIADSHEVIRRIINAETGLPARAESRRKARTTGRAIVVADGFPVATLKTGTYRLEIEVKSLRSGRSAIAHKKFWTYRPHDVLAAADITRQTELAARLASADASILEVIDPDTALRWMRYILGADELRQAERLNSEGKRSFLKEFWRTRKPENVVSADAYFARVAEANRRYSLFGVPGWRTDRGRVFILYGPPDRVQQMYATAGELDHEIWEYNQLDGSGAIFVFLDRGGFGNLDLVHSTKRGEIYNPNWSGTVSSRRRILE